MCGFTGLHFGDSKMHRRSSGISCDQHRSVDKKTEPGGSRVSRARAGKRARAGAGAGTDASEKISFICALVGTYSGGGSGGRKPHQ